ncbi:hypothetical protein, partial [Prauserella halophila]|uniref:hypothetical protein n=1 Tax=Prauserella halophila TaxID=185641 RepID=UPI0031D9817E
MVSDSVVSDSVVSDAGGSDAGMSDAGVSDSARFGVGVFGFGGFGFGVFGFGGFGFGGFDEEDFEAGGVERAVFSVFGSCPVEASGFDRVRRGLSEVICLRSYVAVVAGGHGGKAATVRGGGGANTVEGRARRKDGHGGRTGTADSDRAVADTATRPTERIRPTGETGRPSETARRG